jgi:hypothetical protein
MIEFAQNPPLQGALAKISALIADAPNRQWAALVDTAFDYRKKQPTPLIAEALNIYDNAALNRYNALASMRASAPILIPLPPTEAPQRLATLVEHCGARPMLSFVELNEGIGLTQLVKQWEPLHRLYNPDINRMMVLRFADTRSLAVLPQILTPAQWRTWHANIFAWHYFDRSGWPTTLPQEKTAYPPVQRIEVDDAQLTRFTDAAEADTVLDFILHTQPGTLPENIMGHRYYVVASKALAKATAHGIESWPDRVIMVSLAADTNGLLWETPEAEAWLKKRGWKDGELYEQTKAGDFPWPQIEGAASEGQR